MRGLIIIKSDYLNGTPEANARRDEPAAVRSLSIISADVGTLASSSLDFYTERTILLK